MKLKELEGWLQQVQPFEAPKILLEQYPTPPTIAAQLLFTMDRSYGDIVDANVADLGVGCGMLGIGAAMLGAGSVTGFDIDPDALTQARANSESLEVDELVDFVLCDVARLAPIPPLREDGGGEAEEKEDVSKEESRQKPIQVTKRDPPLAKFAAPGCQLWIQWL